jgi:hypothetical protein
MWPAAMRARTSGMGRSRRQSLHGLHAPARFEGAMNRSGRWAAGMMWSAVVERTVQTPGTRRWQMGLASTVTRESARHARLDRQARISAAVELMVSGARVIGRVAAAR